MYFQTKKNKKYITNSLLKYFNVSLDKIKKIPHQSRGKIYKDVYIEKNNYSDFLKIKVLAKDHIIQTYKNNALKLAGSIRKCFAFRQSNKTQLKNKNGISRKKKRRHGVCYKSNKL